MNNTAAVQELNSRVLYSVGRNARTTRTKPRSESWPDFVQRMTDYAEDESAPLNGNESDAEYKAYKMGLHYIAAQFNGDRSDANVDCRSLLWLDIDAVSESRMTRIRRAVRRSGFAALYYTTTGHKHAVKGVETHSARVMFPTSRPMLAAEIAHCQHALNELLMLPDTDGTADQPARIMFVPAPGARVREYEGEAVDVEELLAMAGPTIKVAQKATGSTDSEALRAWAFEKGLDLLPSGRGWAIQCPNSLSHTGDDGSDGSTAIMMPGSLHTEVRFNCQHDHCKELNSHQHMLLSLCGVPAELLPEAHNISARKVAELLPDVDAQAVSEAECAAATSVVGCNDDDLADYEITTDEAGAAAEKPYWGDNIITGRATIITAAAYTGKSSFITGMMGASAAQANFSFGGSKMAKGVNIILAGEGYATALRQKQAAAKMYGDDMDNLVIIDMLADEKADLLNPEWRAQLVKQYKGQNVVCVAPDTIQTCCKVLNGRPFDENDNNHTKAAAQAAEDLAKAMGCAVIYTAHPAKDVEIGGPLPGKAARKPKGGSDSFNSAGTVFYMHCMDAARPHEVNIYMEKHKGFAAWRSPMGFVLTAVKIADEEPEEEDATVVNLDLPGYTRAEPPRIVTTHTGIIHPMNVTPFVTASHKEGKEVVEKTSSRAKAWRSLGLDKAKLKVLFALEQLTDEHPENKRGFSQASIKNITKASGTTTKTIIESLVDAGLLAYGRDEKGRLLNGEEEPNGQNRHTQYILPLAPGSYEDLA